MIFGRLIFKKLAGKNVRGVGFIKWMWGRISAMPKSVLAAQMRSRNGRNLIRRWQESNEEGCVRVGVRQAVCPEILGDHGYRRDRAIVGPVIKVLDCAALSAR